MSSSQEQYNEYTWIATIMGHHSNKTLKQIINDITKKRTIVLDSGLNMKLVWENKKSKSEKQIIFTVKTYYNAQLVMTHAKKTWFHATRWNNVSAESKFSYKKFSP